MKPELFLELALAPALRLLPVNMGSPSAAAMVLAICLQESRLINRRQIGGPARGYPQFERSGGVRGVLTHAASKSAAAWVCRTLDYPADADAVYVAIEHNDVLACAFARLLLWTLPRSLPGSDDPDEGWNQYIAAWRPGQPHRPSWNELFEQAWQLVVDRTENA